MTFAFKWQTRKGVGAGLWQRSTCKYVPQSRVHRVLWHNICDGHQRSPGRCLLSLPPTGWAGVWPLGKVSPGHRDPESRGRDWQHYTLSQRPTLGHQQRRSRVSSRKQLRTRHRSDTITVSGQQWWRDRWNRWIKILSIIYFGFRNPQW